MYMYIVTVCINKETSMHQYIYSIYVMIDTCSLLVDVFMKYALRQSLPRSSCATLPPTLKSIPDCATPRYKPTISYGYIYIWLYNDYIMSI